jgi:hypothetical protein
MRVWELQLEGVRVRIVPIECEILTSKLNSDN